MINKIKSIINEFRANNKQISLKLSELDCQNRELEWSQIYHDSIRGKKWIEELPLNVGRWAGNYSFFYVLNRILSDYKPEKILDLGLGESSKFISAYIENYLFKSSHIIVEQDKNWIDSFQERCKLSTNSKIIHCPLYIKEVNGFDVNLYQDFDEKIIEKFDLYIVDGPFGSLRYSRYNIVSKVVEFNIEDEFIILIDDTHRQGEKDTFGDIVKILKNKKIDIFIGNYIGNKTNTVIATKKYKLATSF